MLCRYPNILKILVVAVWFVLGAGCVGVDTISVRQSGCGDLDPAACQEKRIIDACSETVQRYAYSRDRLLYDEYADLFTDDAVFQIEGYPAANGKQAIIESFKQRGSGSFTRHFSQVVNIDVIDDNRAKGISYFTLYLVNREAYDAGQRTLNGPSIVGEYHDEFAIAGDQCLIRSRKAVPLLTQNQ